MNACKYWTCVLAYVTLSFYSLSVQAQVFNNFVEQEEGIKISYPSEWHIKEYHKPDLYQLFITRESFSEPEGQYHTGMSLVIFRHASRQLSLVSDNPEEVTAQILNSYDKELLQQKSYERSWSEMNTPFLIGDLVASRSQARVKFQDRESLGLIIVCLYLPDDLYLFHFEAPLAEFEASRPVFEEMIRSIEILRKDVLPTNGMRFAPRDKTKELEKRYANEIKEHAETSRNR